MSKVKAQEEVVKADRTKRLGMVSILPTHESHQGSITLHVVGSDKAIEFKYHVPANLSDLLLKAIDSGFSNRFSIAAAGIKDSEALVAKLEKEVEALSSGKFATRTAAAKTEFTDIIHAYALSELADSTSLEVLTVYQAKWTALTREEKIALRTSPKVKRQLNNIENARFDEEVA